VSGRKLASPVVFSPGGTPLRLGDDAYRGRLMLVATGKRLQVVNALPLESYLLGVVGEEMPHDWPAAALEAQAVAARTYALAELENGVAGESPEVTAAVRATARRVVLYGDRVANTYFFSSSGGRTVPAVDVFGKPVPYLTSVDDPYDTLSPYHDWGPVLLDAHRVARALKVPGELQALDLSADSSGHVTQVAAVGANGTVTLQGTAVRTTLGLRSTWFSVGWLALDPPAAPLAYGVSASLSGVARGLTGVSLETRSGPGPWQPVLTVEPGSDGAFTVAVDPTGPSEYRLAAGAVATAPVKVAVAPAVSATLAAGTVAGSVRPPLPGAAVQLQRQDGSGWRTVATAKTDTAGAYTLAAQLGPGAYRVRCAPGHGLAPGVSPPIQT
jgi:SpoIID/LytB domain protein